MKNISSTFSFPLAAQSAARAVRSQTKVFTILTAAAAAIAQTPGIAQAGGQGTNYIGPSLSFSNSQSTFGVRGKIGIADNLSIRPFVTFPTNGTNFGGSLTYDFDLRQSATAFTPFFGAGLEFVPVTGGSTSSVGYATLGADFNLSESFSLTGSADIPFAGNNGSTQFIAGANFRF
jgi:hypothetical protein